MKAEYKEGPEARENFERALTKIFQAPKKAGKQPKKATGRKISGKNKGQNGPSCPVPTVEWWSESTPLPVRWA